MKIFIKLSRIENRFSSFDSLLQQESLYLKNLVAKISALNPSLVLVEKTVSRLAQDYILAEVDLLSTLLWTKSL